MTDWRMDGWVQCPGCGTWLDGACVFGDAPEDDIDDLGIRDGTTGECDTCLSTITVHLTTEPKPDRQKALITDEMRDRALTEMSEHRHGRRDR